MSVRRVWVAGPLALCSLGLWTCSPESFQGDALSYKVVVSAHGEARGSGRVVNTTQPVGQQNSAFRIDCNLPLPPYTNPTDLSQMHACWDTLVDAGAGGTLTLSVTPAPGNVITSLGKDCGETEGTVCTLSIDMSDTSPQCEVRFDPLEPQALTLFPNALTLTGLGQENAVGISATVHDQLGQVMGDVALLWSSSDETVATVSGDGLTATVTGVAAGSATISAQADNGVEGSAVVTIDLEALTIFDEMETADSWFHEVLMTQGGASTTARHEAAGGVEGGYRHIEHVMPGVGGLSVFHGFTGQTYDPSTEGAISSLDGSYYRRKIMPEAPSAVGERFALKQGETVFYGPVGVFSNLGWELYQLEGAVPSDFLPAPGPDFSASGGTITFGFLRTNSHTNDSHLTMVHGTDKYQVVIRR